ncbi:MAG: hypothetical protein JO295_02615, partial [Verrucomicrobia bacterium]|nr:hypothetical protein [Verrucomicrobiota bacterium]
MEKKRGADGSRVPLGFFLDPRCTTGQAALRRLVASGLRSRFSFRLTLLLLLAALALRLLALLLLFRLLLSRACLRFSLSLTGLRGLLLTRFRGGALALGRGASRLLTLRSGALGRGATFLRGFRLLLARGIGAFARGALC